MPQYPSISTQPVSPREAAEAAVRAWCGWHVSPVIEEPLTLDGNGTNRIALPSNMVHAVNELLVDGMPVEGFTFSRDGWIQLPTGCLTPRRPGCITAVITHGWDSVPDVQKVIQDFTARAAMCPRLYRLPACRHTVCSIRHAQRRSHRRRPALD